MILCYAIEFDTYFIGLQNLRIRTVLPEPSLITYTFFYFLFFFLFFVEYTWRVVVFLCHSDNFDIRYCFYKISENFELEFKDFKE